MSLQFYIPQPASKVTEKTLIKGFGLPLVQRALIGNIEEQPTDKHEISRFGTPVFDALYIERPEYSTFEYDEVLQKYTTTPIILASNKAIGESQGFYCEGVIIEANQPRNIVTTQVSGYDKGSIAEFINNGDWNITIRGFVFTNNADVYPITDAQILHTYCAAPVPLKVTSRFINNVLGVDYLIVTNPNFFQQQGLRNIQYFELTCISNVPYTIPNNAKTA
jgi:Domain of unknown function (DUF6046)